MRSYSSMRRSSRQIRIVRSGCKCIFPVTITSFIVLRWMTALPLKLSYGKVLHCLVNINNSITIHFSSWRDGIEMIQFIYNIWDFCFPNIINFFPFVKQLLFNTLHCSWIGRVVGRFRLRVYWPFTFENMKYGYSLAGWPTGLEYQSCHSFPSPVH